MKSINIVICVVLLEIFILSALSHPIDLFNTDKQLPLLLHRNNTGPGICKENINNDNITNIKWYRYHNETHKCYHIDERQICGKLMLFYGIGETDYGDCDCNLYYRCARPIIYWPAAKRCYYTNDQGPCAWNEWIVMNKMGIPTCQFNPCLVNQTESPSSYDRYWFEEGGICYKTLTQGYCKNSNELLYPKWDEIKPSCNVGRICNARNVRSSKNYENHCIPGQKIDQQGNCRPVIRVTNWFSSVFFLR